MKNRTLSSWRVNITTVQESVVEYFGKLESNTNTVQGSAVQNLVKLESKYDYSTEEYSVVLSDV